MTTINRGQFSLKKLKLLANGGVMYNDCITLGSEDGIVNRDSGNREKTTEPAETLTNPVRSLKEQLKAVFPFKSGFDDKVKATGISISGEGDNRGIVITGTFEVLSGRTVAINSDRITFSGETPYGIDLPLLEETVEIIEDEAFEYIYNGKKAQMTIMFDEVEEVKPGKKGK